MEQEALAISVAEMRGEMRAVREIFNAHTQQDMEQFTLLAGTVEKIDEKMDQLLLREATRAGELAGMKRSAVMLASSISLAVSVAGVAIVFVVG